MNRRRPVHGLLVLPMLTAVALVVAAAHGQTADNRNASTWYRRAIEQYHALPEAQRQALLEYDPASGPPSADVRAALAGVQDMLGNLERGAAQEHCDFDLDYSQGVDLLLPHLNSMRQVAKVARADALVRLHDGDSARAAARMAALYRASAHNGDDRIIISSLVGNAIFALSDNVVQTAVDSASLNPADAATLLEAAQSLSPKDPFAYVEAVAGEQEIFVADMKSRLNDPAKLTELFGEQGGLLAGLNDTEAEVAIGQYDAVMTRVVEIFSMEDRAAAKAELDALGAEVEMHQHDFLTAMVMPAFSKVFEQRAKAEDMLAQRIEVLEGLAAGHAPPEAFANAATWYLRGIELLEGIDAMKLESMRALSDKPQQPDVSAVQILTEAQPIVDVFRDGSFIKRCDFKAVRSQQPLAVAPGYVCGMHDALRFIELDARRLMAAGDNHAAADRLALGLRVIGHVSADPHLSSALVAHHDAAKVLATIESGLAAGTFGDDHKAVLRDALQLIPRKDPFGYLGAIVETRRVLAEWLNRQYTADQDREDVRTNSIEAIKTFNGDQLLYVLAMVDAMQRASLRESAPQQPTTENLSRLADVISHDQLDAASAAFHRIAPKVSSDGWAVIAESEIPSLIPDGTIGHDLRKARGDLREAFILLKASQTGTPSE